MYGRSRLTSVLAPFALVLAFSECGGRTALHPFDAGGAAGDEPGSGGSSFGGSSLGGSSFGGTPAGGSFGGSTAPTGGAAMTGGVAGAAGRAGFGGGGLGGSGGSGPRGGSAGALGGDGGLAGEAGEGGAGDGGEGGDVAPTGLALGAFHTCVSFENGRLRCWGTGGYIGSGDETTIGDDETPDGLLPVRLGGRVVSLAAGWYQTCVVLDGGSVRCFGSGVSGALGYGNTDDVGDDEVPASSGFVPVGSRVRRVSAGANHTCAALTDGRLRCWGRNASFQLGYPDPVTIGDDESPSSAGDVDIGGLVVDVAAGLGHTCALLEGGRVRCFGQGSSGRLGYANQNVVGDDESPASAGDVELGGPAIRLAAGAIHTCALLEGGAVRCWGSGTYGSLGYGNTRNVGDDETPSSVGDVDVGGRVTELAAGDYATCALLESGSVRCWGSGQSGELGRASLDSIGDDETPASAGAIEVGGPVTHLDVGFLHVCAILANGGVRCWGRGSTGALGYGNPLDIGDDETPASAGDVSLGRTP
jgi:alpha-tubulin suppressor-like RCC1 family protein